MQPFLTCLKQEAGRREDNPGGPDRAKTDWTSPFRVAINMAKLASEVWRVVRRAARALAGTTAAAGLCLAGCAAAAAAQPDYAREQRWADEITPAILVGEAVYLALPGGRKFLALYTAVPQPRAAAIIVHGLGLHPDWGLINTLRSRLPESGYATLAIQMPVLASEAKPQDYAATFPEATERLRAAVTFLQARKIGPVAIVAHSMGARMTNEFLAAANQPGVAAWVSIGLSGALLAPQRLRVPMLDLYGERDLPAVLEAAPGRSQVLGRLPGSAQVQVSGADHFFNDREAQLVQSVTRFLDRSLGLAQP